MLLFSSLVENAKLETHAWKLKLRETVTMYYAHAFNTERIIIETVLCLKMKSHRLDAPFHLKG